MFVSQQSNFLFSMATSKTNLCECLYLNAVVSFKLANLISFNIVIRLFLQYTSTFLSELCSSCTFDPYATIIWNESAKRLYNCTLRIFSASVAGFPSSADYMLSCYLNPQCPDGLTRVPTYNQC